MILRISKYQFIKHLKATGNLTDFKNYITGLAWDDDIRLEWEFAPAVASDGLLLTQFKASKGFTDQQVQDFLLAALEG